jgi:hypothetical protein
MTTPALVAITPAGAWQKVATNITNGRFIKKKSGPDAYYYTYVDTGDAAPTTTPIGNAFDDEVELNNSVAVDFYIYCNGAVGQIETQL